MDVRSTDRGRRAAPRRFGVLALAAVVATLLTPALHGPASAAVPVAATDLPSTASGTVTDLSGVPVNGAWVWAFREGDAILSPTAGTTTASDGSYGFDALPPGAYVLAFIPPPGSGLRVQWSGGGGTRQIAAPFVVDGTGAPITGRDEHFVGAASMTGVVRGPSGVPLAGVTVAAYADGQQWSPTASTVTAADGSYRLDELVPGSYQVAFRPAPGSGYPDQWYHGQLVRMTADSVQVAAGAAVTGIDGDLLAIGSIAGTATAGPDGQPVAGVRVVAYATGDSWVGSYEARTVADGTYVLPGVRDGTYQLHFEPAAGSGLAALWYGNIPIRASSTSVVVAGGANLTGTDVTWAPGA